jgi:hypothetical protein
MTDIKYLRNGANKIFMFLFKKMHFVQIELHLKLLLTQNAHELTFDDFTL